MSMTMQPPDPPRVLIVIPVYNHAATLPGVVKAVAAVHPRVLVVDDGSADLPADADSSREVSAPFVPGAGHPLCGLPALCVRHARNRGKGAAVMTGAITAKKSGMTHILTIDADGQHDPGDIPAFIEAAAENPPAIHVGTRDFHSAAVPFSSRFGRAFSNFWYTVHTGASVGDVQSGFRLYPLAVLEAVRCSEKGYAFEVEILVRANWAGFAVESLPVKVRYPPAGERVSHFRPLADNIRITLLNTRLTIRAVMPVPQKKFTPDGKGEITPLRPLRSLRLLLSDNATPKSLALGSAVGVGLGTLPLVGLHSIAVLLATGALRLNKTAGLAFSQLCMPPFVPALCIEAGHYMRHGRFLTEISLRTLGYGALDRIWEWILGSLVLAPLFASLCGGMVWISARILRRSLKEEKKETAESGEGRKP
jgi:uncharacterized protein (DUF2062 family)